MKEKLKQFAEPRVRNKNQTQGFLYVIIGGYLCYLAFSLVKAFLTEDGNMSLAVTVLFAMFFVLFGLAIVAFGAYAIYYNYKQTPDPNEPPREAIEESTDEQDSSEEFEGSE